MKRRISIVLLMMLTLFPIWLPLNCSWADSSLLLRYLPPALFILSGVIISLKCIPGRLRVFLSLVSSAGQAALFWYLKPPAFEIYHLLMPLMWCAAIFMLPTVRTWQAGFSLFGVGAYVMVQFMSYRQVEPYTEIGTPLLIAFLIYMLLLLLTFNDSGLEQGYRSRSADRNVRLLNRLFTMGLFLIGVLIALIPEITKGVLWLWDTVNRLIEGFFWFILNLLAGDQSSGGGEGGGGGLDLSGLGEGGPTSPVVEFLTNIFIVLTIIAAVVLFFFGLRFLWRKLKKLIGMIAARFRQYLGDAQADYIDEVEDTRTPEDRTRPGLLKQLTTRRRRIDRSTLAPTERVRYDYSLLMQEKNWSQTATPRENLPAEPAALYEQARYSSHALTEEQAGQFERMTNS